ncbi:MAG: VWA domain-containing protein [Bryobacteraceae bacterium]
MRFTIILFGLAGALAAQPTAVIRTETREVLVDAIVTDKNGGYVGDLTAKDFRVSQDGKEQAIKGFSLESSAATAQARSLVLFFDETSMEARDQIAVRQAASNFIDAEAGPNHMMAIVVFNGSVRIAQSFTDNAGRLKDALNQASFHGLAPSATDSDNSHDPDRAEEARAVGRSAVPLANAFASRNMIRALGDLGRSLGVLPGRKIVILFTGTLPSGSDPKSDAREAVEVANKSGVAFYPVDVRPVFNQTDPGDVPALPADRHQQMAGRGGLGAQGDLGDNSLTPDSGSAGQSMLFNLANGTGGFVVRNTSDLLGGLQTIGKEQDQYYVLTYLAPESKEGTCHSLKVKVDRKQTTVRSRTSYCTEKPLDLLAGTAAGKELEKHAEAAQNGDVAAFIELPYFYVAPNVARVDLAMEIQADNLKFENRKGKLHGEVNFLGIATSADGEVRARFSDSLKLDFDNPSQVDKLKGKSLHYEKEFKITPGQYTLTVTFSQGENDFGKVQAPLVVDPWAGDFGLSALALSRETHPVADLGLAPALEGRTPLVAQGAQLVPSGSWTFAKSEPAFVYFEIYGAEASTASVRMRILDRKSGEQKWDSGPAGAPAQSSAGKALVPAAAKLPFDSLSSGSYQLEVTAVDSAGKEVKRTADLEVR